MQLGTVLLWSVSGANEARNWEQDCHLYVDGQWVSKNATPSIANCLLIPCIDFLQFEIAVLVCCSRLLLDIYHTYYASKIICSFFYILCCVCRCCY
jgi:hypothetical protein